MKRIMIACLLAVFVVAFVALAFAVILPSGTAGQRIRIVRQEYFMEGEDMPHMRMRVVAVPNIRVCLVDKKGNVVDVQKSDDRGYINKLEATINLVVGGNFNKYNKGQRVSSYHRLEKVEGKISGIEYVIDMSSHGVIIIPDMRMER